MFPNSPGLLSLDEALSIVCTYDAPGVCVRLLESVAYIYGVHVFISALFSSLSS